MYCTNCGRELAEDAKFCPHCGDVVDEKERGEEAEQPAESAPEQPGPDAPAAPAPTPTAPEPAYQPTMPEAAATPEPVPPPVQPPAPEPPPPAPAVPEAVPPPVAQPTPTPTPEPVPPAAQPTPPTMAAPTPGQVPPQQPAPPPPTQPPYAGAVPPAEAPKKGGGKCWLIGCIILLVLGIIGTVVGWVSCKCAANMAGNTLQNIESTTNGLEIWEPGEDAPTNVEEIVGRLGEAVEGLGQMASGAGITGFNPSDVEPAMLGPFYGFMGGLAADDPKVMYQFMSPSLKESWDPDDWSLSTGWKHMTYTLVDLEKPDSSQVNFEITEVIRKESSGEETTLTWIVKMAKTDGTWAVDDFGQPSED